MSKLKFKFHYNNQYQTEVNETHQGPIKLDNLYESYLHPQYDQIKFEDGNKTIDNASFQLIGKSLTEDKPSEATLNRYKSAGDLVQKEIKNTVVEKKPTINVEEVNQSEFKHDNTKKKSINESNLKPATKGEETVVLKAPSFSYKPSSGKDEGLKAIKKDYIKAGEKTEKYLYTGIPQKNEDQFVGCCGCGTKNYKSYEVKQE